MASGGPSYASQARYNANNSDRKAILNTPAFRNYQTAEQRRQREVDQKFHIAKQRRHIHVLCTLCTNRLPKELVLHILALRAASAIPELTLKARDTLHKTAENLLGVDAPESLVETMKQVILESVPLHLVDITYRREGAETIPKFPDFLPTEQLRTIRTLVLTIDVATHLQYPAQLFRVTAGMASLRKQLPNLHHLRIIVRLRWSVTIPSMQARLAEKCTAGYAEGTISYRKALERMVRSVQNTGLAREQSLRLCWENKDTGTRSTPVPIFNTVAIGQWEAGDVLELAMGITGEGVRSNVSV
ncbi:hypothetical protein LTR56_001738 [Elasticomyces elasticus]|nr:hypothetical protein LTR56_001738 [Elasticomyces elasticus]KAK3668911.1 hypothetical protein LTR22_000391 [Elasticomyces elasticus]KAK4925027.1 hypothetical protein LTR49_008033 [Elasticomyces elasticus]KAK5763284.1 hypothetical protein LTS12_006668 [Elasticomyces elasticus]